MDEVEPAFTNIESKAKSKQISAIKVLRRQIQSSIHTKFMYYIFTILIVPALKTIRTVNLHISVHEPKGVFNIIQSLNRTILEYIANKRTFVRNRNM